MARITGGEAHYNERRKIGDYEHRDVKMVLSFALEDGDDFDEIMDRVTASVKARALAMLQNQIAAPAKPAMSFQTPDVGKAILPPREVAEEKPALKVVSPEPEKRGRGRPPKMPSMTAAPVPTPIEAHIEKSKAEESWAGLTVTPEAVETSDDWDAIDAVPEEPKPAAPVKTITDKELMAACSEVMAKLGNGIAIKKVIGGFAASLVSIKQEDRAQFIAKIKQL